MDPQSVAFIPHCGAPPASSPSFFSASVCARRRPRAMPRHPRMAKFSRKEEPASPAGGEVDEASSSPLRPPGGAAPAPNAKPAAALPTLPGLSGRMAETDAPRDTPAPRGAEAAPVEVGAQGAGLSAGDELKLIAFLKDVYAEFGVIEWPAPGRVVKVTIIVLATMVLASGFIYTVDGFFLWLSKIVFETSV